MAMLLVFCKYLNPIILYNVFSVKLSFGNLTFSNLPISTFTSDHKLVNILFLCILKSAFCFNAWNLFAMSNLFLLAFQRITLYSNYMQNFGFTNKSRYVHLRIFCSITGTVTSD